MNDIEILNEEVDFILLLPVLQFNKEGLQAELEILLAKVADIPYSKVDDREGHLYNFKLNELKDKIWKQLGILCGQDL